MIELPQRFENDIQGRETYLVPLVVIDNSIYISIGKITLDGIHYDPILKSTSTIRQSVDVVEKNFKISSVDVDLYNYEYNNIRIIIRNKLSWWEECRWI